MTTSEGLKRFRKRFGLSQKKAAEVAGVHLTTYQKYEYDEFVPPITSIINLADEFGVSIDYLVGRSDTPETDFFAGSHKITNADFLDKIIFDARLNHAERLAQAKGKIDNPAIEYADTLLRHYHKELLSKLITAGVTF